MRTLAWFIGATLVCALAVAPAASAPTAFEQCKATDNFHDIDAAVKLCTAAIDDPSIATKDKAYAYYMRGEGLYWAERLKPAMDDLNQAIILDATLHEARIARIWASHHLQQIAPALLEATQLLAENERDAEALFAYGAIIAQTPFGSEKAIAAYQQALEIDPDLHLARFNLASEYFNSQHDSLRAFAELDKLVAVGPERLSKVRFTTNSDKAYDFYGVVREDRGEFYQMTRQLDKARAEFDWVIATYPKSALAYVQRGYVNSESGDHVAALRDAETAIRLDPYGDGQRILKLGALHSLKRFDDVKMLADDMVQGPATAWGRSNALFYRALVHEDRQERQAALDDYEMSFMSDRSALEQRLQRLIAAGYYDGQPTDEYSEAARRGLQACIIDPEC